MSHFTQLNLDGKSPRETPAPKTARQKKSEPALIFGGLILVTLVSGALLLVANGCSRSDDQPVGANSAQSAPAPVTAAPAPLPTAAPTPAPAKPAKKKVAKKKAATVAFADPNYGVSFRYPRNYILKAGEEPHLDLAGLGPVKMNFTQPGGETVVAVELPRNSYPGADVSSAYFAVNVNPKMSADECSLFASTDADDGDDPDSSVGKVKVGNVEFDATEETLIKSEARYYHIFQNGTCYEFGLGLGTAGDDNIATISDHTYVTVFDKLEKILDSVKIQSGMVSEVATRAAASSPEETKQ